MEERYWDQELEEEEYYEEEEAPSYASYVRVNGMNHDVAVGSSFKEAVQTIAREAGLGKFRVLMGGSEILKSEAPELFTEGMRVELRPYDVAG